MSFLQLPSIEMLDLALDSLPPLKSEALHQIPRLLDKPQNPILDTLRFWHNTKRRDQKESNSVTGSTPNDEECVHAGKLVGIVETEIWSRAYSTPIQQSALMSWDAIRVARARPPHRSGFLTEQSGNDTTAGLYFMRPYLQDSSLHRKYVSAHELFESLRWTVAGSSSAIHIWDATSQKFTFRGILPDQQGTIVLIGNDEVVSESFIQRFLSIGTLIRRLDICVSSLRTNNLSPVFHAFTHSISSILAYIMATLSNSVLLQYQRLETTSTHALTAIWVSYGGLYAELDALATFCGFEAGLSPEQYRSLPKTDIDLVSHIYGQLHWHVDKQSPQSISAQFAYIFSVTAQVYFQEISVWVGYPSELVPFRSPGCHRRPRIRSSTLHDDDNDEASGTFPALVEERTFPDFIPGDLSLALNRARKSLVLLRSAQPDHPILANSSLLPPILWFWTSDDVEAAYHQQYDKVTGLSTKLKATHRPFPEGFSSEDEMQVFALFELEPGSSAVSTGIDKTSFQAAYNAFLDRFPSTLPSLTPTLHDLMSLVLKPLTKHIGTLSSALVDLFLCPTTHLYLPLHLQLLRSYLLLTSHSFKSTLQSALFSDYCGEEDHTGAYSSNTRRLYQISRQESKVDTSARTPWTIGISPALTPDGTWPPAGASLSFFLRTVIIDSLNLEYRFSDGLDPGHDANREVDGQQRIIQEAEWRLGFAIRDLPVGNDAKWLRARCMEALDFLYMEYQPPEPLITLITPTILSKYHRIFAFNLRLMRVDNVIRALFRMSRRPNKPLFPTFAASHKLFLHFRFVSHAFVAALSSYVYDTAIRRNFDAFLALLTPPSEDATTRTVPFTDVFALADYHSNMMDDMLSACLLRSGQKPVGDLLRGALDIILEFGLLMSDIHAGHLKEYQAVSDLETLFKQFYVKTTTLVRGRSLSCFEVF
ncbi:Spc98 family-domain-containing protein [Cristinia sonorae]|uniref:Spindle pole body component n=1 Tax=Cristinia sonorae TaxID=1940300 RepID=A0A8K0UF40_9AGAR|nr:Spc98 family-domain-containing protein [Cristinia sonorae]